MRTKERRMAECRDCLLTHVTEENIQGKVKRGRRRKQLLDD